MTQNGLTMPPPAVTVQRGTGPHDPEKTWLEPRTPDSPRTFDPVDIPDDSDRESDMEKLVAPAPPVAPDGGTQAWLVVLGGWCTAFCSFGWLSSIGVFQQYYSTHMLRNYEPSSVAWIPSMQIFFILGMGPIVGTLFDKFGPRWLILGGSFLHVFGIMLTSGSNQYWQILIFQGMISGVGVAFIFQPPLNCLNGWFNKKRGAAFGIQSTGASVGGVIFPIAVNRMIDSVGYGWAMRTCAFLMIFLLVVANMTVKAFVPPQPKKLTPAQLSKPFKEPEYLVLAAGFFFLSFGIFGPMNFVQVAAKDGGVSASLLQYMVPIMNAASLFGRLFAGFIGDKIGRYNIFIIVCYLSGIWILALWIPAATDGAFVAFALFFGFSSGAYLALAGPLIMQVSPLAEIGFRTGMVFFVSAWGGLATNPINGALSEGASGFTGSKIFSGVLALLGTTLILVTRIRKTGFKLMAKF